MVPWRPLQSDTATHTLKCVNVPGARFSASNAFVFQGLQKRQAVVRDGLLPVMTMLFETIAPSLEN